MEREIISNEDRTIGEIKYIEESLTTFKDSYLNDLGELLQKDNELEAKIDRIEKAIIEHIERDFKWKIRVNKVIGKLTGVKNITASKQKSEEYLKENK